MNKFEIFIIACKRHFLRAQAVAAEHKVGDLLARAGEAASVEAHAARDNIDHKAAVRWEPCNFLGP